MPGVHWNRRVCKKRLHEDHVSEHIDILSMVCAKRIAYHSEQDQPKAGPSILALRSQNREKRYRDKFQLIFFRLLRDLSSFFSRALHIRRLDACHAIW